MKNILSKIVNWYKIRRAYIDAVNELHYMSDRELADIGISRCDIDRVVRISFKETLVLV